MKLTKTQQSVLDELSSDTFITAKQLNRRSTPFLALYELGYLTVRPVDKARTQPLDSENPRPGLAAYAHPQEDLLWKKRVAR